jgi:hypothetical protein
MNFAFRRVITIGSRVVCAVAFGVAALSAPTEIQAQAEASGGEMSTNGGTSSPNESGTLAPAIPVVETPIAELLLREVPIAERAGLAMRVIRIGEAGTLSEPGVLDLPEEGGFAMRPLPFDWIRTIDRSVEVRQSGSFSRLAVIDEAAQVIVVNRSRLELLTGTVEMTRRDADENPLSVGVGEIEVYGRGRAVIDRDPTHVAISVTSGQFEVYDEGSLVGILAAGNDRRFPIRESSFSDDLSSLRSALSEFVIVLRNGATLDGEFLSGLWSTTRRVATGFAYREESFDPTVHHPDVIRRDIGEALRVLKAFRFGPAEAIGM